MKGAALTVILLVFAACALAGPQDPASQAEAMFDKGDYGKGLGLLNSVLRRRKITHLQRAEALISLGRFYEQRIGNPDGALRKYKAVRSVKIPINHPLKLLAANEVARIRSLEKEYKKQNAILKKASIASSRQSDLNKIAGHVEKLKTIVKQTPQYYKLVEAYYYLGLLHMNLKEYGKAVKALDKCTQLKPSINFYLPVGVRVRLARERWIISTIGKITWVVLGAFIVIAAVAFYLSRPWRWVELRHLALGLSMVFLWCLVFGLSHKFFAATFQPTNKIIREISVEQPSFINAAVGEPGSEVAGYLLSYGLAGVLAVFLFSVGTSRLKHRRVVLLINSVVGLLLFTSLTAVFYIRHCDGKSKFNSHGKHVAYYSKANFYFVVSEPEPYILTNPEAYSNLRTSSIDDPVFKEWVTQYCPFDKPNSRTQDKLKSMRDRRKTKGRR